MGRLKVTPAHKRKRTRPITRIGKKQYLRRRFSAKRKVERAGDQNEFFVEFGNNKCSPTMNYANSGVMKDPSVPPAVIEEWRSKRRETGKVITPPVSQRGTVGAPVTEQEGTMIANLILKHGADYKRMSLDSKLNPFQLSASQLQRRVGNYVRWERAAFPEQYSEAEAQGWDISIEKKSAPRSKAEEAAATAKKC